VPLAGGTRQSAPPAKRAQAERPRADRLGDPLPPGALARMGTHRLRHPGGVYAVAFSPAESALVAAAEDRVIRLWDRATGKEVRTLTGHGGAVMALAFSRDGKTLASASRDRTVILWDAQTGRQLRRCAGHQGEVWSVVFSRDGKLVL